MTLRQRALRAGAWTVASYGVELSTRLLTNLVMTRLLFPEAFGVVAAATALIVGLQLLSDFGVRAVIIRSTHGDDPKFLQSAWTFQCSRGVLLWLILTAVCAVLNLQAVRSTLPPETVFANDYFPSVACVLGITLALGGCESTAIPLNIRQLNFRPIVLLDLTARIIPVPLMIALAYLYPNVWSIVAGALAGGIMRAALSHAIIPGPRMRFAWHQEHINEIVAFGKWVNLSSIATFISSQSDVLLLGLWLPGPLLGIYFIAKTLSEAIGNFLERLNSSMTLSVLGEIVRRNPNDLRDRYYQFRLPIELVAASSAGFLFSAGDLIVNILYDHRYAEAGIMLRILSFGLLLYPSLLIRGAFAVVGKPNIVAWISVLQAVSLTFCMIFGFYVFGPLGGIAGAVISRTIPSVAINSMARGAGWISPLKELRCIPIYGFGFIVGKLAIYVFGLTPSTSFGHSF
ncbi:Membrane protein involved in the export of O-antigen and teichoic acid [Bradyrhizobium erythrophlei]|nr:Membrane protein involved in the export of O-antigen and teichoic acid [Bradyrhizobium erythrophlei]